MGRLFIFSRKDYFPFACWRKVGSFAAIAVLIRINSDASVIVFASQKSFHKITANNSRPKERML
jgi:hypothetical protein